MKGAATSNARPMELVLSIISSIFLATSLSFALHNQAWGVEPIPAMKTAVDTLIAEERRGQSLSGILSVTEINQLLQGNVAQLERSFLNFEKMWGSQPAMELHLHNLYWSIDSTNSDLLLHLNDWVAQSPSYIAYSARGIYLSKRAFYLRGTRYAKETPDLNFELMRLAVSQAKRDLLQAIQLKPSYIPPYTELISLSMLAEKGSIDPQALESKIRELRPDNYQPREKYLETLEPRWGGSYEAMFKYADAASVDAKFNPLIWMLTGLVYYDMGRSRPSTEFKKNIRDFTEALKYGESNKFLYARGYAYLAAKDYPSAISDYSKCASNNSSWADYCTKQVQRAIQLQKGSGRPAAKQ